MQELFKYTDNKYIEKDIKRLKKWTTLEDDILNHFKMFVGKLTDSILESVYCLPYCEHITTKSYQEHTIYFHKMRIALSNPKLSPANGARLVFGVIRESRKFIPILVYGACEEGIYYNINSKKLPLQKSGLIKIIDEKLRSF